MRRTWRGLLVAVILATWAGAAERDAHVGYLYPCGGRRGSTFDVVVGGANLNGTTAAYVSGTGVTCLVRGEERHVTPEEQKALKEQFEVYRLKLQRGIPLTAEESRAADAIRRRLDAYGRALANPSLGEFITLTVSVAADAPVGRRELRLLGSAGLTNPRPFDIGDLPEDTRPEWRNVPQGKETTEAAIEAKPAPVAITLPATLNGQIPPGGQIRYRFAVRAGQDLVVTVAARRLNPYIADAVPGWLQAAATLSDAAGREVARSSDQGTAVDPVLLHHVAADGELTLNLRDALYRGREDFVYRASVGELPYVTGVQPSGGQVGARVAVTFRGSNLAQPRQTLDLTGLTPGLNSYQLSPVANAVPFHLDTLPELDAAVESHAEPGQAVRLPAVINGRLARPGEGAWYRFAGRAGEVVVAEVYARRLGSPMDSLLRVLDRAGHQLAANDDQPDQTTPLNTHHADSYLRLTLPADGEYRVVLSDVQGGGGLDYGYRLRLSAPRPDFELRLAPASLTVRGGASAPATVYCLRRDGFSGEVTLELADAPAGFWLAGAVIPAGADRVRFTVGAPTASYDAPVALRLRGRAVVGGQPVMRDVVPADDMTQAFSFHHLVPAQELRAAVVGRFRPGATVRWANATSLRLTPGRAVTVEAVVPAGPGLRSLEFALSDPPDGLSVTTLSPTTLRLEAAPTLKPGLRGNLIVSVWGQLPAQPGAETPADRLRVPLGSLPALPFEVGDQAVR